MSDLKPWQFQPGNKLGGRKPGARTRLQEFVIEMLDTDFREHGQDVLNRVREKWPQIYLTAVISLLPKQKQIIESQLDDLSNEEVEMVEQMLAANRARLVKKIEQHERDDAMLELEFESKDPEPQGS